MIYFPIQHYISIKKMNNKDIKVLNDDYMRPTLHRPTSSPNIASIPQKS